MLVPEASGRAPQGLPGLQTLAQGHSSRPPPWPEPWGFTTQMGSHRAGESGSLRFICAWIIGHQDFVRAVGHANYVPEPGALEPGRTAWGGGSEPTWATAHADRRPCIWSETPPPPPAPWPPGFPPPSPGYIPCSLAGSLVADPSTVGEARLAPATPSYWKTPWTGHSWKGIGARVSAQPGLGAWLRLGFSLKPVLK